MTNPVVDKLLPPDAKRLLGVGEVLRLAIPTAMGMMNATILQFIDGWMVANLLGPEALSAQFVGGIAAFAPTSFAMGVGTVVNTFVSQCLGAGRRDDCSRYTWQGLYLSVVFALLMAPLVIFGHDLFAFLNSAIVAVGGKPTTAAEVAMQTLFFQYMIAGAALNLMARVLEQFFYGIGRPMVVYAVSTIAVIVNIILGYVLITGAFGFPRMGLAGSALGTVIAWGLSLALYFIIFLSAHRLGRKVMAGVTLACLAANAAITVGFALLYRGWPPMRLAGVGELLQAAMVIAWCVTIILPAGWFLLDRDLDQYQARRTAGLKMPLWRQIIRVGWPAGMQFFNDILAWGIFITVLVGYFGEMHRAASAVVMRYLHVSFMPAVGVGIACTALVGRYIGQGRPDIALRRARAGLLLAVAYMGVCGILFYVFRFDLMRAFASVPVEAGVPEAARQAEEAQIIAIGSQVFVCAAVFQCFDAVGIVFVGALRGAGDTFWPMVITFAASWALIVGGGCAFVRYAPGLTSVGPWVAGSLYVIVLGAIMAWRFESGKWRSIHLLGDRPVG
jgi:MATE family multidrug resistance protein